ncbi:acyl-[acyl-carrier-protein] thioesterase [Anaeromyxobacter oryzae]|uniref:Acyl-ACP thioesterase n=1 Tax=Anaeromyxobacter oryzae TaxID=2918170 RepID=A0ABN6MWN1_9BACT|nr:acyl-ACP thioesterase domain-containing protein [Anaeromyxobacter oryzae]BDG03928.1 acyl-ACP thioesterase [Anaeromyxobacter oryzae]
MTPFHETFAVHSYEVDAFAGLAVPALSGFLVEAAGLHAAELGVGLDTLMAKGLTWVLVRQRIEQRAPIVLGDVLDVETWPAGMDRLAALRDFVVRRDGEEVARGNTQWFVLDLATRKPVRPDAVLDPRFPRERTPPALDVPHGRLPELATWDFQKRFHIRYADIDVNLHVNNGSYVAWALEAIPRDVWQSSRLATLDVQYLAECHYGSAILSRLVSAGPGAFHHAIVREEDQKELARVTTAWTPRSGGAGAAAR